MNAMIVSIKKKKRSVNWVGLWKKSFSGTDEETEE